MGRKFRLRDYTAGLPNRRQLLWLSRRFRWLNTNNNGAKWNVPHYWMVDYFFLNSPMEEHYRAFIKAQSEHQNNLFRSQLLNQMILTFLVFLENPQQHGYAGITPILKTFGTWKNTFIRKYCGLLIHNPPFDVSELRALPPLNNADPKYYYKAKFGIIYANRIYTRVYNRAIEIQPKFQAHVIRGEMLNKKQELDWKIWYDKANNITPPKKTREERMEEVMRKIMSKS